MSPKLIFIILQTDGARTRDFNVDPTETGNTNFPMTKECHILSLRGSLNSFIHFTVLQLYVHCVPLSYGQITLVYQFLFVIWLPLSKYFVKSLRPYSVMRFDKNFDRIRTNCTLWCDVATLPFIRTSYKW